MRFHTTVPGIPVSHWGEREDPAVEQDQKGPVSPWLLHLPLPTAPSVTLQNRGPLAHSPSPRLRNENDFTHRR